MNSFSLLRTNPALSTNVKIMVDTDYNLFLESIDSTFELSASRFKKMQFNKDNYYDELVPYFFKDFPVDIAFTVAYEDDNDNMSTDFANQYDELYVAGARNIINNKSYTEEYEYFAPLYLFRHHMPKYFIIFRVDGPGLVNLTKDNFRKEFFENFKTVKVVNLTKETPLGEWMNNNFTINVDFPDTSLDVDFRELEFTRWRGIDYESGGYTWKSFYMDENFENENSLFDFEKLFTDGFRVNKIIHPQILNLSFLFDDTPATPTGLRKWSMNRYSGFYVDDIEEADKISPFKMAELHSDVVISNGNVLMSQTFGDPFVEGFKKGEDNWVEYNGDFYKVEKFDKKFSKRVSAIKNPSKRKRLTVDEVTEPVKVQYRIISDIDLTGKQLRLNKKHYYVDTNNHIIKPNGQPYSLVGFDYADINLIEIDGKYHNLIKDGNYIKVNTDYGFTYNEDYRFEYFINSGQNGYKEFIDLFVTNQNPPSNFKIYRVKFTDVKDFDTQIIDTEFSKFEYEKRNDLTKTEESKMYLTDLRSNSNPAVFDDFVFKSKTEYVPVSSDYTANLETFRVKNQELSDLWRKNPIHCRWGYQNSLSANDYPYLLNNSDIHEKWNRTVDTRAIIPKREKRNLDYFYTINSGTISYLHHSLHVEKNGYNQDVSYEFGIDKYLGLYQYSIGGLTFSYDFDHFELFFSPTQSFMDNRILYSKRKYSWFEQGDSAIPNMTVFRGMKFKLYEVDSIVSNAVSIDNINLRTTNDFENYKFSVLLSSNDNEVADDGTLYQPYYSDGIDSLTGSGPINALTTTITSYDFSDNAFSSGLVGFLTVDDLTGIISPGDIVEIQQDVPFTNPQYNGFHTVVSVTSTKIVIDVPWGLNTPAEPGIIIVNPGFNPSLGGMDYVEIEFPQYQLNTTTMSYIGSGVFQFNTPPGGTFSPSPGFKIKMQWDLVKDYNIDESYQEGDLIYWENTVFQCNTGVTVSDPSISPTQSGSFQIFNTMVYNPFYDYTNPSFYTQSSNWVYMYQDYYYYNSSGNDDFWNPYQSYTNTDYVIYDNRYFQGATTSIPVGTRPLSNTKKSQLSNTYWSEVPMSSINPQWLQVPLWDRNNLYDGSGAPYVVYDEILYKINPSYVGNGLNDENIPGIDPDWERVYSFVPDTDFKYSPYDNPYIKISDYFYYSKYNFGMSASATQSSSLTLDNGIRIYINKRWKNVLVNIAINDNTVKADMNMTDPTKNVERDRLYIEPNSRLTAANFIRQINDLDTKYGFADYVTYIIIEEDGTIDKHRFDLNLDTLPYFLLCEEADEFDVKIGSLQYRSQTLDKNILKPFRVLENGNIDSLEKLNFYNEVPIGVNIINSKDDPKVLKNYNSQTNITTEPMMRHSGNYMPLFYDVELFNRSSIYDHGEGIICNLDDGCNIVGSWTPTSVCVKEWPSSTYSCSGYQPAEFAVMVDSTWTFSSHGTVSLTTIVGGTTSMTYEYNSDDMQLTFGSTISLFGLTWSLSFDSDCLGFSMSYMSPSFSIYYNFDAISVERDGCESPWIMRSGNYVFDTSLSLFGVMKQRLISKVNTTNNILKLRNNDSFNSIYPMLDEYGYMVADYFIFKSTWDYLYHYNVEAPVISSVPVQQNIYRTLYIQDIIKNYNGI